MKLYKCNEIQNICTHSFILHENEKIKSVRRGLRGNRVMTLGSLDRISRRKARRNWSKSERQFERHTKQVNTGQNRSIINSLNAELNPICHLLALLGAHHILHISRIRVKFVLQLSFKQPRANFHTIPAMVYHIWNNSLFSICSSSRV